MLKKDITVTFVGQMARVFVGIVGSALLARALGPDGRGLYALAILVPATVERCLAAGMTGVNGTFAGLYRDQRKALFAQSVLFTLTVSALGMLAMAAYFFWLPVDRGKFAQLPAPIVLLAMAYIPVQMASNLFRELARGCEQIVSTVVVVTCGFAARALAILGFVMLMGGGLWAAVWITLAIPAALAICHVWQLRAYATLDPRQLSWPVAKHSFRFGGILTAAAAATFLTGQVNLYVLTYRVASVEQIGLFAVAVMVATQIQIIPNSVSQVFLPRASNDPETRLKQTPFVFRCTLIASIATMLVLVLIGPPGMIVLYGRRFSGSIVPFLMMLPGITLFGSTRVLGMYL
ncbi:hypothetical protein LCGC14_1836690, partial [marine sediment metagenome]